jgi:drug/metabolite transporter (DMT)-like permease
VTIGFGWPQFSGDSAQGNLIYLAGVILECVGMVFATKVVLKSSGIGTVTWMAVGNALCLALLPLILPKYFPIHIHEVSGSLIGALVYLIFVAGVICFTAWYHIAKNAPLSIMVICMGIEPIFAAILGHSILGEPITPKAYMGSALVLTSLFIVATEKTTLPSTRRKVLFEGTSEEYYRSEDKDEVGVDLAGVS